MGKPGQILGNVVLYGFLLWLLYDSTYRERDPWFAVVVAFVLVLSIVVTLVPGLHARTVSPGEYPYDD
ncbi:MAG TPA: hypothetical protein VF524_09730 [Polyangia bacterium]